MDVIRFERGVREGRDLIERGRTRRGADTIREALALWRGQPFAGLADEGALRAEATRLEELRLHAVEARIAADLHGGRAAELVDELEGLVAAHPFRERLWGHLMLALYRAGRQADALAAYHRARTALDEQLGIEPGEELRDLETAILRQDVPAPGGSREGALGLPVALTRFVGRSRELDEVLALLDRARLVTLLGVGGVGKTRLAVEGARRALEAVVDTVAFVDLAPLADPTLVEAHVAASLGVGEAAGRGLVEAMTESTSGGELLLVLDNCEHLREATAELAEGLLKAVPKVRILATSRVALDVAGEATYPVRPLALPAAADPSAVRASEAVQLLLDRASLTRHDLPVDDAAYDAAARICQEVDGLPLAIELAAARTKVLSLAEIAARLRDRFQFLVSWRRLSPARHRTLREAMDWSYELLARDEQRLLARLSVFPAGATLASIAEVCVEGALDEAERLIERLVDASLVNPIEGDRGTRYRLLETVRQYAAERLTPAETAELGGRHAERVRAIARSSNLALEGNPAEMDFELAREELPSIRAAIRWAEGRDPSLGLEIACDLERFWVTNHAREGISVFTALLAHDGTADALRARGFRCRGGCRYYTGDFIGGVADYEQALTLHKMLGQKAEQAHLLMRLAIDAHRVGDGERARTLHREAAATGGGDRYTPDAYVGLSLVAGLAFDEARVDDGFETLHRAVDLADQAGDTWWRSDTLSQLAERALALGRLDEGGAAAREALLLARSIGDRQSTIFNLALVAQHAAAIGDPRRAGRIWGGLEAEVERGGPVGQWELERDGLRATVAALAGPEFTVAAAQARSLSLEEVIAEALSPG